MKIKPFLPALILAIAASMTPLLSQGAQRVLVLGFDSAAFTELQDRLLREAVMKDFSGRGYAVIPVMEVESLIQEEGISRFRKSSKEDMKDFCERLGADIAVGGKIALPKGIKAGPSNTGVPYAYTVSVFIIKGNQWDSKSRYADGEKDFSRFIGALSKGITDAAVAIITAH